MSLISKIKELKGMDKEDWGYFWEDYKKQIIMYGSIAIIVLIIIISCVVSYVKNLNKPPEPTPVEDEIYVGGMDVSEKTQELEDEFEKALNEEYGIKLDAVGFDAALFTFEVADKDGNAHKIVYDGQDTIEQMRKIKGTFLLRGRFAKLSDDKKELLLSQVTDKESILKEFSELEEYAELFHGLLGEAKTEMGYGPCVEDAWIAEDVLALIYEKAYAKLEEALLANNDEKYLTELNTRVKEVNTDEYEEMDGEWTICKLDGTPICAFNEANFSSFFNEYWANYLKNIEDVYWLEGKEVRTSDLTPGVFYRDVQNVSFTITNNSRNFMVVWYVTDDYETSVKCLWGRDMIWDERNLDTSPVVVRETIPNDIICFAVYETVGKYDIKNFFNISDKSKCTVYLNDFVSTTNVFPIPEGTHYVKNNSKFRIKIIFNEITDENGNTRGISYDLASGDELFIDWYSVNSARILPD